MKSKNMIRNRLACKAGTSYIYTYSCGNWLYFYEPSDTSGQGLMHLYIIKQLGVILLHPEWDVSPFQGNYNKALNVPGPIYTPGMVMVLIKMEELTIEVLQNTMRTFILSAYMSSCTLALAWTLPLPFWNIRWRTRIWSETGWLVKQALCAYIHIVVLIDFSYMSQVTHQARV